MLIRVFVFFLFVFLSGCATQNQKNINLDICYDEIKNAKIKPNISNTGLDPLEVGLFFCDLKNALIKEEKERVAEMVAYPTEVAIDNKFVTLKNKEEFLKYYNQIINEKVRNAVVKQAFKDFHGNWSGVEVGRGVIWITKPIDGKMEILRINNGDIHHFYDPEHPRPEIIEEK